MTSRSKHTASQQSFSDTIDDVAWIGPPPLLPSESSEQYHDLLSRLCEEIKPIGALEQIMARELADLTWEIARLRRIKTNLIKVHLPDGAKAILNLGPPSTITTDLCQDWAVGDPHAVELVNDHLSSAGLTGDAVEAETFSLKIDDIAQIDRMMMQKIVFRENIYHEMSRHRRMLASAAETAVKQIDAEVKAVEADPNG